MEVHVNISPANVANGEALPTAAPATVIERADAEEAGEDATTDANETPVSATPYRAEAPAAPYRADEVAMTEGGHEGE